MAILYGISDLHLGAAVNRQALPALGYYPDDWLIVAGDVAEGEELFAWSMLQLQQRFAQVIWTPGNHDLWTMPNSADPKRGVVKYHYFVEICRQLGVATPEDPFLTWRDELGEVVIAPMFTLYDYTFKPEGVALDEAVAWAAEVDTVCTDEYLLHPDPFADRASWCHARCVYSEGRLAEVGAGRSIMVVTHWPWRADLAVLPRVPRFKIWCGTRRTERLLREYPIEAVVYGHLHIRQTSRREGVVHHEVSLGYPRQWRQEKGMGHYLRVIRGGD
ncbi:MAG TPA: metallophosphoesterase [Anaerolineae bacterium]|nr:metallophosphoesterase [Anaerolineae bacterium]